MKDIIILGSGLAGMTAALKLVEKGATVTLVSPAYSERAQSVMAMGGINAALNTKEEDDSIDNHFEDTMRGGSYINNAEAVANLVRTAPEIIRWLEELGVNFTRDENGRVDLRNFGGQKKKRTAYAGARSGKQIATAIIAKCRKYEVEGRIKRMVGWRFHSLLIEDQECAGVIVLQENTNQFKSLVADAVIMAVGGPNGVFGKTTGSKLNDGYAAGRLFRQGVEFSNLEMIQYHPTTVYASSKRLLITEAARGVGGRLYVIKDEQPWYFMEEWYPELGALMPRDVVSQSIYKVCNELNLGINGKQEVYLDVSHLAPEMIDSQLDEVVSVCVKFLNVNPYKEPIPVAPGIHYFMGGVKTDKNHNTNIARLFAAGECSAQYHGANRLGGNSLLGAICGGFVAAQSAISLDPMDKVAAHKMGEQQLAAVNQELENWEKSSNTSIKGYFQIRQELSEIMYGAMGIYRNERQLLEAKKRLEDMENETEDSWYHHDFYEYQTLSANILLARAMVESALARKESRGAHQRTDYGEKNDEQFKKSTNAISLNNSIYIDFN